MIEHDGRTLFGDHELRCPGSGLLILAPGFDDRLLELRIEIDAPMVLNSACRSREYNTTLPGHPRSLHVCDEPHWPTGGCCAVDVSTHRWDERRGRSVERGLGFRDRLEWLAWRLGWSIGYGGTFLHLDRRSDYTDLVQKRFDY